MKKLICITLFLILVLTACTDSIEPPEIRELCLKDEYAFYQDNDFNIYKLDLKSGIVENVKVGDLTSIDDNIYLNDGNNIAEYDAGEFKIIGASPDFHTSNFIGLQEDVFFYEESNTITMRNHNSSTLEKILSLGSSNAESFVLCSDKLYYATTDGLYEYEISQHRSSKIMSGRISSVKEYDNTVFFYIVNS